METARNGNARIVLVQSRDHLDMFRFALCRYRRGSLLLGLPLGQRRGPLLGTFLPLGNRHLRLRERRVPRRQRRAVFLTN